ncbi:MAG TPA: hypothetical protein PLS00_11880, partial [Niabella sp.]|nr:hypothetical protein [Niabella sp.]
DLGRPELKIAGLRINPLNFSPSRSAFYIGLSFKNIKTGKELVIKNLPVNLKASQISWNDAGDKIAFLNETKKTIDLYIADVKTAIARKINKQPLNTSTGNGFDWIDNESILYHAATASPD